MAEAESTARAERVNLSLPNNDILATLVGIAPAGITAAPVAELGAVELIVRTQQDGTETRVLLCPERAADLALRIAGAILRLEVRP